MKALLLRRKASRDQWQTAVALTLSYGSIEADAIANILHQLKTPTHHAAEGWLDERLPQLTKISCQFDLSGYAGLSQGGCDA